MKNHRSERRARIRARLDRAMTDGTELAFDLFTKSVTGYCVGVGERWAMVRVAAPWPDGLAAVRLDAVERVRQAPHLALDRAAFEREGAWPPEPVEGIDLDSTAELLAGLAQRWPVLTMHLRDNDEQCWVGTPVLVAEGTLMLQELSTEAQWEGLSTWRLRDLALLEVDDRYGRLLAALAPERPADPSPFTD